MNKFSNRIVDKINNPKTTDSELRHALSETLNRLDAVIDQANAQFKVGDRHATFNKQFIDSLKQL